MPEHNDPEPWVFLDDEGNEYRARYAREDGIDELGEEWSGWKLAPRSEAELRKAGYSVPEQIADDGTNLDPAPWICIDEEGNYYRTRYAQEDGVDLEGHIWSGWTFSPRSHDDLRKLGLL